jgi:hypothetical protein
MTRLMVFGEVIAGLRPVKAMSWSHCQAPARVDRGVQPPEGSQLFEGERGLGSPAEVTTGTITS